jgi:hypothetical protein
MVISEGRCIGLVLILICLPQSLLSQLLLFLPLLFNFSSFLLFGLLVYRMNVGVDLLLYLRLQEAAVGFGAEHLVQGEGFGSSQFYRLAEQAVTDRDRGVVVIHFFEQEDVIRELYLNIEKGRFVYWVFIKNWSACVASC